MNKLVLNALLATVLSLALLPGALADGPWHAARRNTYGWQFMTPDERVEHQRLMRSFTSYQDCKAYQSRHHAEMAERALRTGTVLEQPRESACDKLRARGQLK
ncbi:MAG: hypothetical protein H6942_16125 [Candidatus Accumulibacter sp.]|uniref:hypothetical protein n=1 Tax=Accumulibacter sp. TaxID=2053492 RepID=UPI0019F022ED|nr:hypothetical protein [Accumulibacter sp.]MBE2257792.1 hypothetical protein [Paracoccaceae bacterium]MCB1943832.1 hypothetical protein [Accumulibacter sp.]MCP5250030.1 hypothetical protein [Accumulibacter sp.]